MTNRHCSLAIRCIHTIALLAVSSVPVLAAPAGGNDVRGEWHGGNIGGTFQLNGCTGFSWVDRVVSLVQLPGQSTEFRGVWTKHLTAIWVAPSGADRAKCRWGKETEFLPVSEGLSRQSLTGHLDTVSGKLTLTPRLIDCQGTACNNLVTDAMRKDAVLDVTPSDQNFTLTLMDGKLVDAPTVQQTVVLRRTGDLAADLSAAQAVRDEVWKHFDNSDFDWLGAQTATGAPFTRQGAVQMRTAVGALLQRNVQVALFATEPNAPDGSSLRDGVMFVTAVAGADGRQGTEILVLWKQEGRWKIAHLGYS